MGFLLGMTSPNLTQQVNSFRDLGSNKALSYEMLAIVLNVYVKDKASEWLDKDIGHLSNSHKHKANSGVQSFICLTFQNRNISRISKKERSSIHKVFTLS